MTRRRPTEAAQFERDDESPFLFAATNDRLEACENAGINDSARFLSTKSPWRWRCLRTRPGSRGSIAASRAETIRETKRLLASERRHAPVLEPPHALGRAQNTSGRWGL